MVVIASLRGGLGVGGLGAEIAGVDLVSLPGNDIVFGGSWPDLHKLNIFEIFTKAGNSEV